MKLVTFLNTKGESRSGWLQDDGVVDMNLALPDLPTNMLSFIDKHEAFFALIEEYSLLKTEKHYSLNEVQLLAPLPNPRSFRDHVAFEEHMQNASKSLGLLISPAWYEIPVFYFTNHHAVNGTGAEISIPKDENKMDIELELACIIGKEGKDISVSDADDYIFGYTIFNDWTARATQAKEMSVNLGPAKGKDFANTLGSYIVTKDEMEQYRTADGKFNLKMTAAINGVPVCNNNFNTIHYTFPQMIHRTSENGVSLKPGDILGSGTVGGGSLIENNFTVHRPLLPGDEVTMEIEGIGILKNKIVS